MGGRVERSASRGYFEALGRWDFSGFQEAGVRAGVSLMCCSTLRSVRPAVTGVGGSVEEGVLNSRHNPEVTHGETAARSIKLF